MKVIISHELTLIRFIEDFVENKKPKRKNVVTFDVASTQKPFQPFSSPLTQKRRFLGKKAQSKEVHIFSLQRSRRSYNNRGRRK